MRGRGKVVGFSQEVIETLLTETTYQSQKSSLLLSLLHFEDAAQHGVDYDLDHIFPQKLLDVDTLVDEYGLDPLQAEQSLTPKIISLTCNC